LRKILVCFFVFSIIGCDHEPNPETTLSRKCQFVVVCDHDSERICDRERAIVGPHCYSCTESFREYCYPLCEKEAIDLGYEEYSKMRNVIFYE